MNRDKQSCNHQCHHLNKKNKNKKYHSKDHYIHTEYGLVRVISPKKVIVHNDEDIINGYAHKVSKLQKELKQVKRKLTKCENILSSHKSRSCSHSSVQIMNPLRSKRVQSSSSSNSQSLHSQQSVKSNASSKKRIGCFTRITQKSSADHYEYQLAPHKFLKKTQQPEQKSSKGVSIRNSLLGKNSLQSKTTPLEYSDAADQDDVMSKYLSEQPEGRTSFFESFIESESGKENYFLLNNNGKKGEQNLNEELEKLVHEEKKANQSEKIRIKEKIKEISKKILQK